MRASRFVTSLILLAAGLLAIPAPAATHQCAVGTVRLYGMALGSAQPYFFYTPEGDDQQFTIRIEGETCPPENGNVRYDTPPLAQPDPAEAGDDYTRVNGQLNFNVDQPHETFQQTVTVPMHEDAAIEQAAESLKVDLTPTGVFLGHDNVPMFIVDDDGSTRVRFFDNGVSWQEYQGTFQIPVFRAGSSAGGTVSYSITPNTDDYSSPSSGQVGFRPDGRLGLIPFAAVNDTAEEGTETFTVTLAGVATESPSTFTVTIPASDTDGGDSVAPRAWFHHPKHRERYRQGSPGADTIHLFADDNSGHQEVTSAQLALRKKMTNGSCKYWKSGSWRAGSCSTPKWFAATTRYPDGGKWLYIYTAYPSLRPSVGTRIATYTVYGRATDASANRSPLRTDENRNTFEVRRR